MSKNGRVILIVTVVAAAIAAFVVLKPGSDDGNDDKTATSTNVDTSPTATTKAPAAPAPERITIRGGKPVGGVQKIEVKKGDTVRLIVSSDDTSQEIHVHGYDLMKDMAPGRPATFSFKAENEGVFEIELEDTSTQIASLQVRPG